MSWRGKYISWYRILEQHFDGLTPDLTDNEIMENVTQEDQFIIPTNKESKTEEMAKAYPNISIKLSETGIELGILYNEADQFALIKNIFRETHTDQLQKLLNQFQKLDDGYETVLYSKSREEKSILIRKYVTSRVDKQLIGRVIDEAESLRKGGRQIVNNQSTYVPPKNSELYLTRIRIALNEEEYKKSVEEIKPIYETLTEIKTQREIISDRLSKPRIKRNLYREFIETLNEARKRDLISAEKMREINKKWREDEDERESLLQYLMDLINQDKTQVIS
jgi:hypothetical protein